MIDGELLSPSPPRRYSRLASTPDSLSQNALYILLTGPRVLSSTRPLIQVHRLPCSRECDLPPSKNALFPSWECVVDTLLVT